MKIVDTWSDDHATFFTVKILPHRFIDIKRLSNGYAYIIKAANGLEVYDEAGRTYKQDIPERYALIKEIQDRTPVIR